MDYARLYPCRDLSSRSFEKVVSSYHFHGRLIDVIGIFKRVMSDNSPVPFEDGFLPPGNFDCAVSTMVLGRLRGLDVLST